MLAAASSTCETDPWPPSPLLFHPTGQPVDPPTPSGSTQQGSTAASTSSSAAAPNPSLRKEAQLTLEQYKEIYDRLISIFQTRPRDDWKKLIVFSKQWPQHQNGVFDRWVGLGDGGHSGGAHMHACTRAVQNGVFDRWVGKGRSTTCCVMWVGVGDAHMHVYTRAVPVASEWAV